MGWPPKLADVGTSVFTRISGLALVHNAINLAQGFPDFDCDVRLRQSVVDALQSQKNQYAPMAGLINLRQQLSSYLKQHQVDRDPETEITITAGATQGLFTAIASLISPGDEVIIIEPAYDSYAPSVRTVGGFVRYYTTTPPKFGIDWDEFKRLITVHTKMIIVNTPNNPSGVCLTKEDLVQLATLVVETDIILLSDEVYEALVYDGEHLSPASIDGLAERTISVYSFGKTLHCTGWKVGYVAAPAKIMEQFRRVHQFNVFCVSSFVQYGLLNYIQEIGLHRKELIEFYRQKRDLMIQGLVGSSLLPRGPQGSYFILCDYSNISNLDDEAFNERLIQDYHIAAIPLSAFYHSPMDQKYIRLCFAKKEDTLERAILQLKKI
jgi:methionine transaminase